MGQSVELALFDIAFVFGGIGFEFLFAVVAAEGDFFTFMGHGDVGAGRAGADRAGFVDRSGRGDAGEGCKGEGKEKFFHIRSAG